MSDLSHADETFLHDLLDHDGVPFRSAMSDTIQIHGSRKSGWSTGLRVCEITDAKPLIPGLAGPIHFQWQETMTTAMVPTSFQAYLRTYDNTVENYDWTLRHLEQRLGAGIDSSVSNTRAVRWRFGDASVEMRVFPPELNPRRGSSNRRHDMIPGSDTECSINIEPAYVPAPSDDERRAIESYECFHGYADQSYRSTSIKSGTRRYPSEFQGLRRGFGFDSDRTMLVLVGASDRVTLIPVSQITAVACDNLTPAKGSGGAYLSIAFHQPRTDEPTRQTLASGASAGDLDALSRRLSEYLQVPLREHTEPDV